MKGLSALMVFVCAVFGVAAISSLKGETQIILALMSFGFASVFMILLGILRRLPQS